MKILVKLLGVLVIVTLFLYSCDDDDESSNSCIEGNVIAFLECGEGALIQVTNQSELGKGLIFNGVEYENVVQAPGNFPEGKIYFTYREYDKEKDSYLFKSDDICLALYGPYDVPIIVITDYSQINCSDVYEN
jgi:hypothetical protein